MSAAFDPYYTWLSIPPEDQPANFYRLLGVKLFETNLDVIESASDRQMTHVRNYAGGQHAAASQKILNELASARVTLLAANRKSQYDAMLRAAASDGAAAAAPSAPARGASPAPSPGAGPTARPVMAQAVAVQAKGTRFGNFQVIHLISQSTTGTVYKAQRVSDGQIVSLRVIPKQLAESPEFVQRLHREFELTRTIEHPHIVASYEMGEVAGQPYMAFEYVGGADLGRVITEHGPLDVPMAIELTKRVADGLSYLHKKRIVHRNLKPANLLVSVQGAIKISNLTMALVDDAVSYLAGFDQNLTVQGQTIGSPDYLAPEQAADSHNIDGRADLYSLGCTLHHLLAGAPPYPGKNAFQKLQAHQSSPIPSLSALRPEVPKWLDQLHQKLLAKKPADRPASADEVVKILTAEGKSKVNVTLLVACAAGLIVVGLIGTMIWLATR